MRKPRNILVDRKFLDDQIRALSEASDDCVRKDFGRCLFMCGQLYTLKMLIYRANHKKSTGCKVKK
jgi:hypothetical protein